jgi:hypothetical protein
MDDNSDKIVDIDLPVKSNLEKVLDDKNKKMLHPEINKSVLDTISEENVIIN